MMRFTSTLALAASLTLLSLGAQAAAPSNWPAGARDSFVSDCSAAAIGPAMMQAIAEIGDPDPRLVERGPDATIGVAGGGIAEDRPI